MRIVMVVGISRLALVGSNSVKNKKFSYNQTRMKKLLIFSIKMNFSLK